MTAETRFWLHTLRLMAEVALVLLYLTQIAPKLHWWPL